MSSWIQGSIQWNDQMLKAFTGGPPTRTPTPVFATPVPTLPPTAPPTFAPTLPPTLPPTMPPTLPPTLPPTQPPPQRMPRYDTGGVVVPLPVAPDLLLGGDISMLNPVTTPAPATMAPTTPAATTSAPTIAPLPLKKEDEKKGFWTWKTTLLIVLCLAILGAGGYVMYKKYKGVVPTNNVTLKNMKKNIATNNVNLNGLNAGRNMGNNTTNTNNTNNMNNNFVNNIGPPPTTVNGPKK